MMSIIGMFFQNGLTGQAWGDWSLYADSPLRAAAKAPVLDISTQLGACPPLGFWDPLGLSKYPDPAVASSQFRRRRIIEIQHGRVSMFACIGYIVPEGFSALGLPGGGSIADKETKERKLLAEINNGRLAMMAIIGMFFQNGLTGQAWGDWSLY